MENQDPPSISLNDLLSEKCVSNKTWVSANQEGHSYSSDDLALSMTRTMSAPSALEHEKSSAENEASLSRDKTELHVATWNIAAPNNNPFEYWAMHSNEDYNDLMLSVQKCIDDPRPYDTEICEIFTDSMYAQLRNELAAEKVQNLDALDRYWSEMQHRKAIEEFLKDTSFGEKRLISMPDRITSSIRALNSKTVFRPSPITGIQCEMNDLKTWWSLWTNFMFRTPLNLRGTTKRNVFSLLERIPRAKYPALTEAEEAVSLPLQTLCLAVFDAVFTHILSSLAPDTWQPLKQSLHATLFENKAALCVAILRRHHARADVIFIQEASESFASRAGVCLDHHVLRPSGADGRRSQLSLIFVSKAIFLRSTARDLTHEALARLDTPCLAAGDLCVFECSTRSGCDYLLASFHGDSDGACTAPVLAALHALAHERYPHHTLIFGLDANTASSAFLSRAAAADAAAFATPPPVLPASDSDGEAAAAAATTTTLAAAAAHPAHRIQAEESDGAAAAAARPGGADQPARSTAQDWRGPDLIAGGGGGGGAAGADLSSEAVSGGGGGGGGGGGEPLSPGSPGSKLDNGGFSAMLAARGLASCWQGQDLRGLWTTFNARTYLQPQLHKAVGLAGVLDRRHMRLRDWIVFRSGQLRVGAVHRDNTGGGRFATRVMPSQAFPSDHAIVAAVLLRGPPPPPAAAAPPHRWPVCRRASMPNMS